MRLWYQLLSSEKRLANFLEATKRLCARAAAPGTSVEVHGTRHGALGDQYRFFWHYDVREVIENGLAVRASRAHDAFVIANSLDPALVELREMLDIPVLSFMEVCCFTACMMGDRFGLIAPNERMIPRYEEIVRGYGLGSRLAAVEPLRFENISRFDEAFSDGPVAEELAEQVADASRRAIARGAETLILAGPSSTFMVQRGVFAIERVPLLDCYSLLVKFAEAMVGMHRLTGVAISRRLLYASPPADLVRQAAQVRGIDALREG